MMSNAKFSSNPLLLVLLTLLTSQAPLAADPITITNPSFEADVLCNGCNLHTVMSWFTSPGGGDGVFNPTTTHYPGGTVPDGENVAYVNLSGNSVRQVLAATLEADSTYTLEVEVGNRLDEAFAGYRVQLRAGGAILAEDDSSQSPAPGEFVTARVIYASTALDPQLGQPLEIWLLSPGVQANYDNVRLGYSTGVVDPGIFEDGFESGDISAWSSFP